MSAPSHAPTLVGDVFAPDVSSVVTEDDTPVDNFFSEKQQRCLTDPIYTSWEGPPPEEDGLPRPFVAAANVGVFATPTDPPVVPDVLLSVDVSFADDVLAKEDRTYFVWKFGKSPDLVIEIVSNREGEELGKKKLKYRRHHIPYYVVWDPAGYLGDPALHVFELRGDLYVKRSDATFPSLGLGLVLWDGAFEGYVSRWLRWVDAKGELLATGAERAVQEHARAEQERARAVQEHARAEQERARAEQADARAEQERARAEQADVRAEQERARAEQERARAARLVERLRALGIDPEGE
ncbi:MAG: Uma2 family endonuclease [Polyangiales bacterium]